MSSRGGRVAILRPARPALLRPALGFAEGENAEGRGEEDIGRGPDGGVAEEEPRRAPLAPVAKATLRKRGDVTGGADASVVPLKKTTLGPQGAEAYDPFAAPGLASSPQPLPQPPSIHSFASPAKDAQQHRVTPAKPSEESWVPKPPNAEIPGDGVKDDDPLMSVALTAQKAGLLKPQPSQAPARRLPRPLPKAKVKAAPDASTPPAKRQKVDDDELPGLSGKAAGAPPAARAQAPVPKSSAPKVESSATDVQLSELPPDWTAQDVQELCDQYGKLVKVTDSGAGNFVVSYTTPAAATKAAKALSGLQMPSDAGFSTIRCKLLEPDDGACVLDENGGGGKPRIRRSRWSDEGVPSEATLSQTAPSQAAPSQAAPAAQSSTVPCQQVAAPSTKQTPVLDAAVPAPADQQENLETESKAKNTADGVDEAKSNVEAPDEVAPWQRLRKTTRAAKQEAEAAQKAETLAELETKVSARLRELGNWKADERTQKKLAKLTSHIVTKVFGKGFDMAHDRVPALFNTLAGALGADRAQEFGTWLIEIAEEMSAKEAKETSAASQIAPAPVPDTPADGDAAPVEAVAKPSIAPIITPPSGRMPELRGSVASMQQRDGEDEQPTDDTQAKNASSQPVLAGRLPHDWILSAAGKSPQGSEDGAEDVPDPTSNGGGWDSWDSWDSWDAQQPTPQAEEPPKAVTASQPTPKPPLIPRIVPAKAVPKVKSLPTPVLPCSESNNSDSSWGVPSTEAVEGVEDVPPAIPTPKTKASVLSLRVMAPKLAAPKPDESPGLDGGAGPIKPIGAAALFQQAPKAKVTAPIADSRCQSAAENETEEDEEEEVASSAPLVPNVVPKLVPASSAPRLIPKQFPGLSGGIRMMGLRPPLVNLRPSLLRPHVQPGNGAVEDTMAPSNGTAHTHKACGSDWSGKGTAHPHMACGSDWSGKGETGHDATQQSQPVSSNVPKILLGGGTAHPHKACGSDWSGKGTAHPHKACGSDWSGKGETGHDATQQSQPMSSNVPKVLLGGGANGVRPQLDGVRPQLVLSGGAKRPPQLLAQRPPFAAFAAARTESEEASSCEKAEPEATNVESKTGLASQQREADDRSLEMKVPEETGVGAVLEQELSKFDSFVKELSNPKIDLSPKAVADDQLAAAYGANADDDTSSNSADAVLKALLTPSQAAPQQRAQQPVGLSQEQQQALPPELQRLPPALQLQQARQKLLQAQQSRSGSGLHAPKTAPQTPLEAQQVLQARAQQLLQAQRQAQQQDAEQQLAHQQQVQQEPQQQIQQVQLQAQEHARQRAEQIQQQAQQQVQLQVQKQAQTQQQAPAADQQTRIAQMQAQLKVAAAQAQAQAEARARNQVQTHIDRCNALANVAQVQTANIGGATAQAEAQPQPSLNAEEKEKIKQQQQMRMAQLVQQQQALQQQLAQSKLMQQMAVQQQASLPPQLLMQQHLLEQQMVAQQQLIQQALLQQQQLEQQAGQQAQQREQREQQEEPHASTPQQQDFATNAAAPAQEDQLGRERQQQQQKQLEMALLKALGQ